MRILEESHQSAKGPTMSKITIGVIGGGFVGRAVARGFMEYADVRVYDIDEKRATHSWEDAVDTDFIFVCLPTEHSRNENEPYDMGPINSFFEKYASHMDWDVRASGKPVIIIKSTVPVGTTQRLSNEYGDVANIVHSPEFLTARCSLVDYQTPARLIVGVPRSFKFYDHLEIMSLYAGRFPGVPIHKMLSDESELVKLACNSFFATKVAFFNTVYRTCGNLGLDFESVRQGMLSDGRIAHAHTQVPGPDGKLGFGGSCLPKDLWAYALTVLDEEVSDAPTDRELMQSVWLWNRSVRGE